MYKRVDNEPPKEEISGYSYINEDGLEEVVTVCDYDNTVTFIDSENRKTHVYKSDIPKLIKALQAAYDHKD